MAKLKKIIAKFFGNSSEAPLDPPTVDKQEEERIEVEDPHNMIPLFMVLKSRDYGWTEADPNARKVVLTNPEDCADIDSWTLMAAWSGSGHSEWECIWAVEFCRAVDNALKEEKSEADLTLIFSRDYLASRERKFTKEQTWDHISRYFDIISESDTEVKVKIRVSHDEEKTA